MESPEMKYGHVFMNGEHEYLFIKILGSGQDAFVQLILQVQTGELVVRKVARDLLYESEIEEEEDPEKILFLIQSQARQHGLQPNIAHLYSADDEPAPQNRGGHQLLYHRARYFKFYNGGTLSDFWQACQSRDIAPPPSLILTMIQDVVQALHFMYSMKPNFVLHGDLHKENIFLHWEQDVSEGPRFFLGDFGWSTCGRLRSANTLGLIYDIQQIHSHFQTLMGNRTDTGFQSELRKYLKDVVEPELLSLACGPGTQLPDLTRLLELLSDAPSTATLSRSDMLPFMATREPQSTPSPLLHDTEEEAQKARGIDGPWRVGQVSIDPSTGKLAIVSTSTQTYHRPQDSVYDYKDSDSEDGCSNEYGLV